MPLIHGASKKAVQKNTEREIAAGKDPKQAYAIAKSTQRKEIGKKAAASRKKA
jgi:hypothetical protein